MHPGVGGAGMIIDVHTHYFPEKYLDLVEREGSAYGVELTRDAGGEGERELRLQGLLHPPLRPFFDVEVRLRDMEAMGVDVQVIHHSSRPNVLFADPGLAGELCRESKASGCCPFRIPPWRPGSWSGCGRWGFTG